MALMDFKLGDVGGVFTSIREAITGEKIKDPLKLLTQINELQATFLQAQTSIITAEAKSEHWLTAVWRPITMLVFVFIIANNYIIVPYANAMGASLPVLDVPPDLWALIKLGLGGYVLSRGGEKIVKEWKK